MVPAHFHCYWIPNRCYRFHWNSFLVIIVPNLITIIITIFQINRLKISKIKAQIINYFVMIYINFRYIDCSLGSFVIIFLCVVYSVYAVKIATYFTKQLTKGGICCLCLYQDKMCSNVDEHRMSKNQSFNKNKQILLFFFFQ